MKTALVLGGGFAGCTSAHLLAEKGFQVTLLEGGNDPGGGVWTRSYAGHPYTFGPRIFFSRDEQVIEFISSMIEFRNYEVKSWTFSEKDSNLYHYPIQRDDLSLMPDRGTIESELRARENKRPNVDDFETYWIDAIGPTLYEKFIDLYSKKMWGVESNRQLAANFEWVNRGTPIRDGEVRLYGDQFQGYPRDPNGYNAYFERCLTGTDVRLGCFVQSFDPDTRTVQTTQGAFTADVIISSVHIDALFGFVYGKLQYHGRQFIPLWLPVESALPEDVTWIHYSGSEEHTRVTEFKKITGHESPSTLLGIEVPADRGRHYPVPTAPELERFASYKKSFPADFYSIGRLGKFTYQGMPDAVRDAMDVVAAL